MEQQLIPYTAGLLPTVRSILVLAPHPDDEVFGCGGALALHVAAGTMISVVILTDGAVAGDRDIRLEESKQAALLLGYPPPSCWLLPDRSLQYGEELVAKILGAMEENSAELVYAPSLWENHPDHRATALAALEAVRRHGASSLMQYEISAPLRPTCLIDITAVHAKKRAAMACFASQLALQRYDQQINALNSFRTYTLPAVVEAAEAYEYSTPDSLRNGAIPFLLSEYQRQHSAGLVAMPADTPLVSIMIRSMNRPSLDAALASVAAQTWPAIEVLVVNAAGGCHRSLPTWCGRFPLHTIGSDYPQHRSSAANLALEQAQGEYLLFLDDDDLLDGNHIAKLAEYLRTHPQFALVHTGVRGLDQEGRTLVDFTLNASRNRLLLGNFMPIHGVMFRSSLVREQGYRFDPALDVYEDWDFWLHLTSSGALGFVPGISAVYNVAVAPDHPVHNQAEQTAAALRVVQKWAPAFTPDTILGLRSYAEQLESERQQLLVELASRRADIARMTAEHHQLIADHQAVVAEHHQLIADHQAVVAEHHQLIADHQAVVAEHHQLISNHQAVVAEHHQLISNHQAVVAEHHQLISNHQAVVAEHQAVTGELRQVYSSRSWRLTAPIRSLATRARKVPWLMRFLHIMRRGKQIYRDEGLSGLQQRVNSRMCASSAPVGAGVSDYVAWLRQHDLLPSAARADILERISAMGNPPLISVVMPTYNPRPEWLREAIESVRRQSYQHWELCIADDASTDPAVQPLLAQYCAIDRRIKVVFRQSNGHISAASNSALALASGDFVCFLDHDDCLHPDALLELAGTIVQNNQLDLLYTDEDKLASDGTRCLPFFKPDWSPHLAVSQAYLGHLVCYRRSLVQELGGVAPGMEGAQDYDLWLRASLKSRGIAHIPRVLYHWRMHEGSTALHAGSKPYAHEVGRRAVESYLRQRYPEQHASAVDGSSLFTYEARFAVPEELLISIIIPTRNGLHLLQPCIESILGTSTWQHFEIIVLDNGSDDPLTLAYLQTLAETEPRVRVIAADIPFNWSKLNNLGARAAKGDCLVFLNNDTQVITPAWMQLLAGYALLPDIGIVGALLLFEDGTIQHSGVVVGLGGWADHIFRTRPAVHSGAGPFVSPVLTRNVLTVTGACMAVSRERFEQLGGFDESFIICGSDVELGLRAHRKGYYNVICAEARLYHLESKTRTPHIPEEDFRQSAAKYEPYRTQQTDPFYNPNLSSGTTVPVLKV